MIVNCRKTKEILFGSILKDPPLSVTLSGTPVERVATFKLLGVHVANDLKLYHLSPPSSIGRQYESTPELRPPVIHQPQSTPKLVWPSAPPLKDLATPSPVPSPIVKTLTYPQPSPQPIVPVWQPPLVTDDVFEETIEETDMAEERSVMPPPFTGKSEDANDWARHFYKYCVLF